MYAHKKNGKVSDVLDYYFISCGLLAIGAPAPLDYYRKHITTESQFKFWLQENTNRAPLEKENTHIVRGKDNFNQS